MIEGEDVTLTCNYADVSPIGNKSTFYFGEVSVALDKVGFLLKFINGYDV